MSLHTAIDESFLIRLVLVPDRVVLPGVQTMLPTGLLNVFSPLPHAQQPLAAPIQWGAVLCKTYNERSGLGEPFEVGCLFRLSDAQPDYAAPALGITGVQRFKLVSWQPAAAGPFAYVLLKDEPLMQATREADFSAEVSETSLPMLCAQVADQLQTLIGLARKLECFKTCLPAVLPVDDPVALSYLVADTLRGSLVLRQQLLEMPSAQARLIQESQMLVRLNQQLAMRCQIQDAFNPE
ncbi:MAG: LON peptidase substrate-binding domain-containing protein [Vampirovibrionales bacterium]|nr:LON peptidase substrate-binding domain-containing protein [Vampirovibrionales bacterium]